MPYIKKEKQADFDKCIELLMSKFSCTPGTIGPVDPGELEYCIFRLCQLAAAEEKKFVNYNAIVGVLETTKLEFVRRILGPHEDIKLLENWK